MIDYGAVPWHVAHLHAWHVAALGPVALAAHTIVKQIVDFAMAIFGTFSTVAQSLVATCLGKVCASLLASSVC